MAAENDTEKILDNDSVTVEYKIDCGSGFYRVSLKDSVRADYRNKILGRIEKLDEKIGSTNRELKRRFLLCLMIPAILALVSIMFCVLTLKGDSLIAAISIVVVCCFGLFTVSETGSCDNLSCEYEELVDERNRLVKCLNASGLVIMSARYDSFDRGLRKFFTTGDVERFGLLFYQVDFVYCSVNSLFWWLEKYNISHEKDNVNNSRGSVTYLN